MLQKIYMKQKKYIKTKTRPIKPRFDAQLMNNHS
jgi:hypothetical protein